MASTKGSRVKIRAPRRGLINPANDIDFESAWKGLEVALDAMHRKNAANLSFEELYRNAYKIVLKKKADIFFDRLQEFEVKWLSGTILTELRKLVVASLLDELQPGASASTINEKRAAGEKFLMGCKVYWEDHQLVMNMATDAFMYLDRVHCKEPNRPTIYSAGMAQFNKCILQSKSRTEADPTANGASSSQDSINSSMMTVLRSIILEHITLERRGYIIDKPLIKSCAYMLECLFKTPHELADECLYLTDFQKEFIEASQEFYKLESAAMIAQADAASYCKHTSRRLREEQDRCRSTLSESTTPGITEVLHEQFIRLRIKEVIAMDTGVKHMIDNNQYDDLKLVYELNTLIDPAKAALVAELQKRVMESGGLINEEASNTASKPQTSDKDKDKETETRQQNVNTQTAAALQWVESTLSLKDRYDQLWERSFDSDPNIHPALTKSFTDSINSFPRCSEFISLFIDENMKKGIKDKTEKEVDEVLEKAIVLLRYIQDKDMFERYYKKHLCRRLVMQKSISMDVEKQMVSRMKIELGNSFTNKLENMFKDVALSKELTDGYKKRMSSDSSRTELGISVLTTMVWPLDIMANEDERRSTCIFPPSIERVKKDFETFYASKHSGRRLTWMTNMGSADIRATFPKVPGKEGRLAKERRHELNVSTNAMVILLLFNDLAEGISLSYDDIQTRTNINDEELKRNLQSLSVAPKTRILIKEPMSRDIKSTDRFSFNDAFQSQFLKLKVGVVAAANKVEGDKERVETEKKNNEARGYAIDAAVVRIMKYVIIVKRVLTCRQRKELTHSNLMVEVVSQLNGQFKPDIIMIKQQIERLIEREYLERKEDANPPAYRYLA